MKNLIIYIHGKNGSAEEARHYIPLFPNAETVGFDYKSALPWEAEKEFAEYFDSVSEGYDKVCLIANSIGAYFSLVSLGGKKIDRAFFISPVVDMETLIRGLMAMAGVDECELEKEKTIPTSFGETLSWEYLSWVRNHPISWNIPTEILYGSTDSLQTYETVSDFAALCGGSVTVMENGEHWFHTPEQMNFLDEWITSKSRNNG